jgi:alpha-beta hydrolase superfamily lysophospholipase
MIRSAALLLLLMMVALFLFATWVRRTGMFFPERYPSGDWDTSALPVRPADETFSADDGVSLHGWHFAAPQDDAPLLVWFHGNGGNITNRGDIAAELAQRGTSVFVFDWRGYGRSAGRPTERALYRDAVAAYEHAVKNLRVPPERIVLYGESLGGPYAAYVARRYPVRAVIIENSFPSLRLLGNALYAPLPLGWTAPNAMNTLQWLNEAGRPVLVMHGKRDQVIPFRLGKALHDGLTVPKQLLVSENAGHCEIPVVDPLRYYNAVGEFAQGAR